MRRESHIERNSRLGQTSEQLSERNELRRLAFYGLLGGAAGGLCANFVFPSWIVFGVFVGGLIGLGVAISISRKMQSEDQTRRSKHTSEMAAEREREREHHAKIKAAKENGEFDRWEKE